MAIAYNPDDVANYRTSIFGRGDPEQYQGIFEQAYGLQGQPAPVNQAQQNDRYRAAAGGTNLLADQYIKAYATKNGKNPDAQSVLDFVANNMNTGFATKYLGGLAGDQVKTNYVDPYLDSQPGANNGIFDTGNYEKQVADTNGKRNQLLNDIFSNQLEQGKQQINNNYADQERRAIAEQAATGTFRAPIGNSPSGALGQIRSAKDAAMNELIRGNTVGRSQAQFGAENEGLAGILDAKKFGAGLTQQQNQFGATNRLANKQFNLTEEDSLANRALQQRQLTLAEILGRKQAEANKPGTLDYIKAGTGMLTGGAGMAASLLPLLALA